ncbi:MAG: PQQ-like beta-propeller repeat protein [Myxococcota bacterium]|nr:PQQ-like beta-propeller repeat protein [Myxococcota bacterium]
MRHAHVLLLVSLIGCATAQKKEETATPAPQQQPAAEACGPLASAVPGGIAEPAGAVLFLGTAQGLEAVDAASGVTLWRSPSVTRALAVGEGRIAAAIEVEDSPGELRLALLERSTGALLSLGPQLQVGPQVRGAFCQEAEVDLVWPGPHFAKVDLARRVVLSGPHLGGRAPLASTDGALQVELRSQGGVLRAYAQDGSLRWERPLTVSSR